MALTRQQSARNFLTLVHQNKFFNIATQKLTYLHNTLELFVIETEYLLEVSHQNDFAMVSIINCYISSMAYLISCQTDT